MKRTAVFHTRRVLTSSSISVSSHSISCGGLLMFDSSFAERILGGLDVFLPYVRDYVDTFIGKSITTAQWKAHLYSYWEKHGGVEKIKALDSVNWDAWFYGQGVELPVKMDYDLTLAETAYKLAARWDAARRTDISKLDFTESDLNEFKSNQIGLCFLKNLTTLLIIVFQWSSSKNLNPIPPYHLISPSTSAPYTSYPQRPTARSACGSTESHSLTRPHPLPRFSLLMR